MKKNKRINKKMSVNTEIATHFGAIITVFFIMVIVNVLFSSNCQQMMKRIGESEKELARLEDARNRELTRWEEMKTPDKISAALLRHGLSMKPPRPEQNVKLTNDGKPLPGQISVAAAEKRRAASANLASIAPVRGRGGKRGR